MRRSGISCEVAKNILTLVQLGLLAIFTLTQNAYACACCSASDTFRSETGDELRWSTPITFIGDFGVYVYGESGGPDFAVERTAVKGFAAERKIILSVTKDGKELGALELVLVGRPDVSMVGLDIILSESEYRRLGLALEPPIYHQWKQRVQIKADKKLQRALGTKFSEFGLLVFHGYANNCWSPATDASGNWTVSYEVSKGDLKSPAFGKGSFAPQ